MQHGMIPVQARSKHCGAYPTAATPASAREADLIWRHRYHDHLADHPAIHHSTQSRQPSAGAPLHQVCQARKHHADPHTAAANLAEHDPSPAVAERPAIAIRCLKYISGKQETI